jgi:hypothetical protein
VPDPTKTQRIDSAQELQRYKRAVVDMSRNLLFNVGDCRTEAVEKIEWFVAMRFTKRPHTEWTDPAAMVEECAVDVKPLALECVLLAEKAGPRE